MSDFLSSILSSILEGFGFYNDVRIKNPMANDPPMIPEKYPREQTVIASPTNESKYKRHARRRHTRHHLKRTNRSI